MNNAGTAHPNAPWWNTLSAERQSGFQEVWFLKLNSPVTGNALWIRFTLLSSINGFRRIAETWAILFKRIEGGDTAKTAVKETFDLQAFTSERSDGGLTLKLGGCELSDTHTKGVINSKGRSIRWNLSIRPRADTVFDFIPRVLAGLGIVRNKALTVHEDLLFSGSCEVSGETFTWTDAPGMQGHLAGPRNGHSWVWGHCNMFFNDRGEPADVVFDGLCGRSRITPALASPQLGTFFIRHGGVDHRFNSVWHSLRSRSSHTGNEWHFQADRGELSFRGHARAKHRDFAGVTYEDTDGSYLYCYNSKVSEMNLLVYRRGKLEATFNAPGTASFEVVTRTKNPYVPLLI